MWPELLFAAAMSATTTTDNPSRFLALGDSYTIGEGVIENQRWSMQLATQLRQQGVVIDTPQIIAKTGWTTDELSVAMDDAGLHPPYALVTLLIGVNNQYRGRDLENYRSEFSVLLQRAIYLAGNRSQHVVVLSIPDWGVTRFGQSSGRDTEQIARELDAYNAISRAVAKQQHVRYVDITDVSRVGGANADMLTDDGLHPSAAMYEKWTALLLPEARAALSSH